MWRAVYRPGAWVGTNDMPTHLDMAGGFTNPFQPNIPHFLFHASARTVSLVPGVSDTDGAFVTLVAAVAAGGLALRWLFRRPFPGVGTISEPWALGLVAAFTVAESLGAFAGPESFNTRTPDYLPVHTYFNPTATVLLPLAIVAVQRAAEGLLAREAEAPTAGWWVGSLALVGATLAKPSLTITLLPAGLVLLAVLAWRGELTREVALARARRWTLVYGLPSGALLLWQWRVVSTWVAEDLQSTVLFDPLWVVREFAFWKPQFWLALLLPILLLAHRRWLRSDPGVALTAVVTGLAIAYLLVFRESGLRGYWAAQFFWPVQLAVGLLWAYSLRLLGVLLGPDRGGPVRPVPLAVGAALQVVVVGLAIGTKLLLCSSGVGTAC